MMIEMELVEIEISDASSHQIIILQEKEGTRNFPIFIGLCEAMALDTAVKRIDPPRPMTHDLIVNSIDQLGGTLTGIVIDELRDEVFHGKLLVRLSDGDTIRIDCRPSDATVLAMKARVPIYVEDEVLAATTREDDDDSESDDDDSE